MEDCEHAGPRTWRIVPVSDCQLFWKLMNVAKSGKLKKIRELNEKNNKLIILGKSGKTGRALYKKKNSKKSSDIFSSSVFALLKSRKSKKFQ